MVAVRIDTRPTRRPAGLRSGSVGPPSAVYRRRRLAAAGLMFIALAGGWFALQATVRDVGGGPLTATGVANGIPVTARTWVVRPGDTLWDIALASGVHGDIRPYVDAMAAETGGRPLVVGEQIALPVPTAG